LGVEHKSKKLWPGEDRREAVEESINTDSASRKPGKKSCLALLLEKKKERLKSVATGVFLHTKISNMQGQKQYPVKLSVAMIKSSI